MAVKAEPVARKKAAPDSAALFLKALTVSLMLHLLAVFLVYFLPGLIPARLKPVEHESYVVHLVDPGPLTAATKTLVEKKTRRKTDNFAPPSKSTAVPKKIVAVKKETPIKKTVAEKQAPTKKVRKAEKEKVEQAEVVREKKSGGKIDIKKFPYEWYLGIMESKIYGNWDTLSINFFTERPLRADVYFQINRQGRLLGLKLENSSGREDIDKSVLDAVRLSEPFPPLPPGYEEDILEVHFGFKVEPKNH